jgi:hypothetical protein
VYLAVNSGSFTKGFYYWDGNVWTPIGVGTVFNYSSERQYLGASNTCIYSIPPVPNFPYLKSVTIATFNSIGKVTITGIVMGQNNILACSVIVGYWW